MMFWDCSFKVANPHKDAIALLCHLYKSKHISLHIEGPGLFLPSNRLYVVMELEAFYNWLPSSMISKPPTAIPARHDTFNPIDEQNMAFTKGFLRHILPALYDTWQFLHNRASAPSLLKSRQTLDLSAPSPGIKYKPIKRQTPQVIY